MPPVQTASPAGRLTARLTVERAKTRTRALADADAGLVRLSMLIAHGSTADEYSLAYTPAEARSLAAGLAAAADYVEAALSTEQALAGAS